MSCESIFRDISDIHSRLFNHRAALQGLAKNFVKEFEEKRGEAETVLLSRCAEVISECKDHSMPYVLEHIGKSLKELKEEANKAAVECNKPLRDAEAKKEWLESQRERRQEEWKEFMASQVNKSARVDGDYETRVAALQKHYSELEEKVKGNTKTVL